jgi:nicotinic acid phosphoribosyltransferase
LVERGLQVRMDQAARDAEQPRFHELFVVRVGAFDRDLGPEVPRIVLVDTFRDEADEALRVAHALGDRLYGIRLDTPSERGRVTADLVHEVRARLDQEGYDHVKITVSAA